MKTTKRSKMLLSSIAMLLVALVALGSATYAWYSIQRTVNADGIAVKASVPGGLQISVKDPAAQDFTESTDWTNDVDLFSTAKTFDPSKLTLATTGTITAANVVSSVGIAESTSTSSVDASAETSTSYPAGKTAADYYIAKDFWIRNTNSNTGYVRFGASATIAGGNTYTNMIIYDVTASGSYTEFTSGARTGLTTVAGTIVPSGANIELTSTPKHYVAIVYVDGINDNCKSENASADNSVTFTLKAHMYDTATAATAAAAADFT